MSVTAIRRGKVQKMERKSGILLPVFSLPSEYGIGSFGKEGYEFIDFLCRAGVKVWQVLPLVHTGYGNSPYSSVCSYSFNPYFISLETLAEENLLDKSDFKKAKNDSFYVDYGALYNVRYPLLRKAFSKFNKDGEEFKKFVRAGRFYDYALFSAIKTSTGYKPFYEWDDGLKRRDKTSIKEFSEKNKEEILFWQFVQFTAEKQWFSLKKYANLKGVKIIGDLPLYVALDSVDVWTEPSLFKLDDNFIPKKIAGVPPDYFSKTGQLWGNPVYDYDSHKEDNFSWWRKRLKTALKTFDYVRIDHFRGLDRYYEVDNGRVDATVGEWVDVPGKELFTAVSIDIGSGRIIAEDLGIIDDGVRKLLKFTGYPGMKILSFAFNSESNNPYLPENIEENSVCYTGTHDNDTLKGLIDNFSEWDYNNLICGVKNSVELAGFDYSEINRENVAEVMLELGFFCKAELFIFRLDDVLNLNSEYRINEPGTVKPQNWAVRLKSSDFSPSAAEKIRLLNLKYHR